MRIACPVCAAAYEVPDARVGEGQTVRCVRCSSDWVPRPAQPPSQPGPILGPDPISGLESAPALAPLPLVTSPAAPPTPARAEPTVPTFTLPTSRAQRGINWLPIAWGGSVALVLGGLVLLVVERRLVVAAWPPALRLFAALGLTPT